MHSTYGFEHLPLLHDQTDTEMSFIVDMQATNVRKDQTITQISSRLTKTERDLKSSQAKFQEEKKLLTSREEELLKAKAEVTTSMCCSPAVHVMI